LCEKCDYIISCAGSGHHLRPDRIEPGALYFGKSLPVRPNLLLFKFRFNIFIGVRIIKEMSGFGSEWDTLYILM